jgi:hypothetical protein
MLNLFVTVVSLLVKSNREIERYDFFPRFFPSPPPKKGKRNDHECVVEYAVIMNMSVLFLVLLYFYTMRHI